MGAHFSHHNQILPCLLHGEGKQFNMAKFGPIPPLLYTHFTEKCNVFTSLFRDQTSKYFFHNNTVIQVNSELFHTINISKQKKSYVKHKFSSSIWMCIINKVYVRAVKNFTSSPDIWCGGPQFQLDQNKIFWTLNWNWKYW